jgi:hypothetical protein
VSPVRTLFPLPEVTEASIARDIRAYLERDLGLRVFRANAGASRGRRAGGSTGLPDFFGVLPGGRWWAVEVKKPGAGKRRDEAKQNDTLEHLRTQGALVIVARSVLEVRAAFEAELEHPDGAGGVVSSHV